MNKEDNIQDLGQKKQQNSANSPSHDLDDDKFTFVPTENIQAIESVIKNWENVRLEWDKLKTAATNST
jgi:hypothetical protein